MADRSASLLQPATTGGGARGPHPSRRAPALGWWALPIRARRADL